MKQIPQITPEVFSKDSEPETILAELLEQYRKPSFGSMSKRDVDILMFIAMQQLGIIDDENPKIYYVMQLLHVTRAKARNLIYEVALRKAESEDKLKTQLQKLLNENILLKEKEKVTLEIDNPLVIDYLRNVLKDLKHLTDGSFTPELVKMSYEAFADLYMEVMKEEKEEKLIKKELQKLGITESPAQVICSILKDGLITTVATIGGEPLGKFSEQLIDRAIKAYDEKKRNSAKKSKT